MKVFVYDKKTNRTLAQYTKVNRVEVHNGIIQIFVNDGLEMHTYNTAFVKTRIYQN